MKKYIGIFVSILIIFSCAAAVNAESMKISVSNTATNAGDTVIVAVNAENNPGVALGNIKVKFDNTKLIPVSVTKGDVLSSCWYFTSNLEDESLDATELEDVTFSWMNVSDMTANGTVANLEFMVKEGIAEDIELAVEVSELANSTGADIAAEIENGKIALGSSGGNTTTDEYVVEIASTTISKGENEIGGKVALSVYSPIAESAVFVCGIYNSDGELVAVDVKNADLSIGINAIEFSEMDAEVTGIGKYAVRVYSWNSLTGMKPKTESILKTY